MNSLNRCKPLLGTYVEIQLYGDVSDSILIEQSQHLFEKIERVQTLMSFHDTQSELSKLNQNALPGNRVDLSSEMHIVFSFIDELHVLSGGFFDPTIAPSLIKQNQLPGHNFDKKRNYGNWKSITICDGYAEYNAPVLIDLGGIAKGFAVDCAVESVESDINVMVNAGGDIRFSDSQNQTVSIQTSEKKANQLFETSMLDSAIATSANYYHDGLSDIIDPQLSKQAKRKHSISVFANECMIADALTKVVWLSDRYAQVLEHYNAQVLVLDAKQNIIAQH